ncbi:hypothetical protein AAHE18_07G189400 [Arachis hypogaea]
MCWKIIQESNKNCGQQTRLWNVEEVCNIFQHERIRKSCFNGFVFKISDKIHGVESMIVDMIQITIDSRIIIIALRKMPKLRLHALRENINTDLERNRVFVENKRKKLTWNTQWSE